VKKKILLDVDEVICFSGYLEAINIFMGTNYKIDDFTEYYLDNVAIPTNKKDDFINFLHNYNLYSHDKLLPNCYEVLSKLNDYYDIYILSSCVDPTNIKGCGRVFKDKYDFLIRKLPFLDPNKFIFSGVKNIYKADIIIDDRLSNLNNNDIPIKILFPSYHNKDISKDDLDKLNIIRAGSSWKDGWMELENLLIPEDKINELLLKRK